MIGNNFTSYLSVEGLQATYLDCVPLWHLSPVFCESKVAVLSENHSCRRRSSAEKNTLLVLPNSLKMAHMRIFEQLALKIYNKPRHVLVRFLRGALMVELVFSTLNLRSVFLSVHNIKADVTFSRFYPLQFPKFSFVTVNLVSLSVL